jgi:DNA-binding NarL/FixJ family response regulator
MSTTEIANHLSLSNSAVRSHVSLILKKLQVPNRKAAIEAVKDWSK